MKLPRIPPPVSTTTGEPSFRWRRVSFFLIVGLAFLQLPVLAFLPAIPDTAVNLKIAEGSIDLIGWAFLVYAAGAGAQDIAAIVTTRSGRPYAENPPPTPVDHPPADQTIVVQKGGVVEKIDQATDPNAALKGIVE